MTRDVQDTEKLHALAKELAKGIKTEADLNALSRALVKTTIETVLGAEMGEHLRHEKQTGNVRMGIRRNV